MVKPLFLKIQTATLSYLLAIKVIFHRLINYFYATTVFQIYFFTTLLLCGYSTESIWGDKGIIANTGNGKLVSPDESIWGNHYLWFFFSAVLACSIAAIILGIILGSVNKWKTLLIFLPNNVFLIGISGYLALGYIKGGMKLNEETPFVIAFILLLPVCNIVLYQVARFSHINLTGYIRFNKLHWLWLSIPYSAYFSGFLLAFSIHFIIVWADVKEAFWDRFDFSFQHFLKEFLSSFFAFVFTLVQIIIDLLVSLALNVWKYPLEYTIRFLNGEFMQSMPKWKSIPLIAMVLMAGIPIAALTEWLCYYFLMHLHRIFG